jgi:hypothetical protein
VPHVTHEMNFFLLLSHFRGALPLVAPPQQPTPVAAAPVAPEAVMEVAEQPEGLVPQAASVVEVGVQACGQLDAFPVLTTATASPTPLPPTPTPTPLATPSVTSWEPVVTATVTEVLPGATTLVLDLALPMGGRQGSKPEAGSLRAAFEKGLTAPKECRNPRAPRGTPKGGRPVVPVRQSSRILARRQQQQAPLA